MKDFKTVTLDFINEFMDYSHQIPKGGVISHITEEDFQRYTQDGTIQGGMIPKLENAFSAIHAGVSKVIITQATAIDGTQGTIIEK